MGILCMIMPCKWIHIKNGLYQCPRCKTISVGAKRPNIKGGIKNGNKTR
jgi:hypothetical protein